MSFSFAVITILLVVLLLIALGSFADDRIALFFIATGILIAGGNFVVTACLYILGGYVGRAYLEAKGRPPYVMLQVLEAETPPGQGGAEGRPPSD